MHTKTVMKKKKTNNYTKLALEYITFTAKIIVPTFVFVYFKAFI